MSIVPDVPHKVETWGQVTRIDGMPVPLDVRMEDVRGGGSTELRVSDVVWDRELPDDLFDPRKLRDVAHHGRRDAGVGGSARRAQHELE